MLENTGGLGDLEPNGCTPEGRKGEHREWGYVGLCRYPSQLSHTQEQAELGLRL